MTIPTRILNLEKPTQHVLKLRVRRPPCGIPWDEHPSRPGQPLGERETSEELARVDSLIPGAMSRRELRGVRSRAAETDKPLGPCGEPFENAE